MQRGPPLQTDNFIRGSDSKRPREVVWAAPGCGNAAEWVTRLEKLATKSPAEAGLSVGNIAIANSDKVAASAGIGNPPRVQNTQRTALAGRLLH